MKALIVFTLTTVALAGQSPFVSDFPHQRFRDDLIAAFNQPSKLPSLARWFSDTTSWCDPYPECITGQEDIMKLLNAMARDSRDSYLLPSQYGEGLIQNGASGGLFVMTMAVMMGPQCMAQSPQYASWEFVKNSSSVSRVWWHYDAEDWEQQLVSCNATAGKIMKGRVKGLPAPKAVVGARSSLEGIYAQLLDAAKYPTADPRWVQARMSVFAQPKNDTGIVSCDPYPFCAKGHHAIADALEAHAKAGIAKTAQSMLTAIWVSDTFGAAVTTFTAISPTGCLASHVHLETFQLDDVETHKVRETKIYYSDASMAPHNCSSPLLPNRFEV